MPVLPLECTLYPECLLGESQFDESSDRSWWVLHTKPRQEKALARELLQHETPYYLPLMAKRNRLQGRVFTSHLPFFTGYLFMYASREEQMRATSTYRIVNTLEVFDQKQMWHDLARLHRMIASNLPVRPELQFTPGVRVLIRSGPLAGLKGEILKSASGNRFIVQVNFLQQGASIQLDDVDLALAEFEE